MNQYESFDCSSMAAQEGAPLNLGAECSQIQSNNTKARWWGPRRRVRRHHGNAASLTIGRCVTTIMERRTGDGNHHCCHGNVDAVTVPELLGCVRALSGATGAARRHHSDSPLFGEARLFPVASYDLRCARKPWIRFLNFYWRFYWWKMSCWVCHDDGTQTRNGEMSTGPDPQNTYKRCYRDFIIRLEVMSWTEIPYFCYVRSPISSSILWNYFEKFLVIYKGDINVAYTFFT